MSFPIQQHSYPAGASSTDPDRSRLVELGASERLKQLADVFPSLRQYINSSSSIINAYPATLGLDGIAPSTDTYLHPPTFISAMRKAAQEARPVILAAQPLVGAALLLEFCQTEFQSPTQILWGVGGYLTPHSLESFVREILRLRGCEVDFLYSYGVAEIGHTCFAATGRCGEGHPCYLKVASSVTAEVVGDDQQLHLTSKTGRRVITGDTASVSGDNWTLTSGTERAHPTVLNELESWNKEEWTRRTGYLHATESEIHIQLRAGIRSSAGTFEVEFYEFRRRFGGEFTTKPVWKLHQQPN